MTAYLQDIGKQVRCFPQRVVCKVSVTGRCLRLRVAQELSYRRQRYTIADQVRRERVPQIVDADTVYLSVFADCGPRKLEVC